MTDYNYSLSEDKAPFNMAIDTLRRIGGILNEISNVSSDPLLSPAERQFILVPKVQHFFFQSSPLLKEEVVNRLKYQVLDLKHVENQIEIIKNGIVKKKEIKLVFDPELEMKLNIIILEVQRELQKEKYFMPPKKDLSKSITEM